MHTSAVISIITIAHIKQ